MAARPLRSRTKAANRHDCGWVRRRPRTARIALAATITAAPSATSAQSPPLSDDFVAFVVLGAAVVPGAVVVVVGSGSGVRVGASLPSKPAIVRCGSGARIHFSLLGGFAAASAFGAPTHAFVPSEA